MNVTINAASSSGGSYQVDFKTENDLLFIHCNCRAGDFGKLCKHKLKLLEGDENILADQKELPKLNEIQQWVIKSDFPDICKELYQLEEELERAKNRVKQQKKLLEKRMKEGL